MAIKTRSIYRLCNLIIICSLFFFGFFFISKYRAFFFGRVELEPTDKVVIITTTCGIFIQDRSKDLGSSFFDLKKDMSSVNTKNIEMYYRIPGRTRLSLKHASSYIKFTET